MSKFLNKHFRIFAGVCLSILSVSIPFNFATKSETYQLIDKFNIHTDSGMSSVAVLVYFVAYLSLFFAMATPDLNIRRKLISIASLPLIWASLPYSLRAFKVKIGPMATFWNLKSVKICGGSVINIFTEFLDCFFLFFIPCVR